ncbi:PREDICTED: uncharacterized protein LOC105457890 [Wasmannia auropunctata]|uniref:uncharacterized protein LOC105457890 n=1 Tax=Wasmannia auropunctata TaxID=64793 RepID=UPI0005F03E3D|nr:PREDICTED: uncharacterized protein LOC105457890 [Wasmannia auropunctata]
MDVPPELVQAIASMMVSAIQASTTQTSATVGPNGGPPTSAQFLKPPPFSISEYRLLEGSSVEDYFKRFDWALQLSKISEEQHANFNRVYMGSELNNVLKFLINLRLPEELTYNELRTVLINHFDRVKNRYVESIKFRHIVQQKGESIAAFALRLKQGSAYCEYGEFLDRMLIEQFLHGLSLRDICDEIISKKPTTFAEAYEIAHTLEATRDTSNEVKTTGSGNTYEVVHKLGYAPQQFKHRKKDAHKKPSYERDYYKKNSRFQGQDDKQSTTKTTRSCGSCGGPHPRAKCKFFGAVCHNCKKKGHIAKVCRAMKQMQGPADLTDQDTADTKTTIDGRDLEMELDTGAPCGIVSKQTLFFIKPACKLFKTDRRFASYTGHGVNCIGRIPVEVTLGKTSRKLNLYVVDGNFDSLFGREWISHFVHEIKFHELFNSPDDIHAVTTLAPELSREQKTRLDQFLMNYKDVFSTSPGKLSGPPVSVHFKPGTSPVFARAREVPLALRDAYAKEIDAKIASGFYERVKHSEWASTTHIVIKKNGKLRITDVTDAYTHLPVDAEFSYALTLNTPTHGLIRPTCAVYGAANVPAVWQRKIESVLQDIPNVLNFFNDILVFADNFDNLIFSLDAVLQRLRNNGLKLNRDKCIFATTTVEFLGHKIDAQGIHKSDKHIQAIRDAPKPSTPEELQLFLGKATYYGSFIANLLSRSRPLRDILRFLRPSCGRYDDATPSTCTNKFAKMAAETQDLCPH